MEIVRSNYDSLTLKLQDGLDHYERYSEVPKEQQFFTNLVRNFKLETDLNPNPNDMCIAFVNTKLSECPLFQIRYICIDERGKVSLQLDKEVYARCTSIE